MRELKALIIVTVFTLITYIGIEPFAHTQLHAHVDHANFNAELEDVALAELRLEEANAAIADAEKTLSKSNTEANAKAVESAKKDFENKQSELEAYKELWASVNEIDALNGDAGVGAELFAMACTSCHGLKSQGFDTPFEDDLASESYGVVVPDLSLAGAIYDKKFLEALIINPARALKLTHKFNDDNPFPMTPFYGLGDDLNQEVANIVAYLQSVAPSEFSGKEATEAACLRCHDVKYDKLISPTIKESLKNYMGSNPPDLSIMIRSRGAEYLETFINDPQKHFTSGTAMPRVGLTKVAQEEVISYLEQVGDSKKSERTILGFFLIGFFVILAALAYLWKNEVWKELH